MNRRWLGLWLWLALLVLSALIIARAHYVADLSAFLPRAPSPAQRLLIQQLQDGLASRLILIGIEGGDAGSRALASQALAATLRPHPEFLSISNGAAVGQEKERQLLFQNRYLLSDTVNAQRFTVEGLQSAIADDLDLMSSASVLQAKELFRSDPTGETLALLDRLDTGRQPAMTEGVWSSSDGTRSLLLAQTRATGSDTDAQEQALSVISSAWSQAASPSLQLLLSSPGKFAVEARSTIKREALRLSLLSTGMIVLLLLLVYRSLPMLLLGLLPVVSGAMAGIASVALGFGVVHGITLGFGVTLIGESVDYSIYLFIQSRTGLWPTIMLGVLTSVCGFASLLPSAFPGLSQLGLFSISGLIAAAAVTRFVLPVLIPARACIADLTPVGAHAIRLLSRLQLPRVLYPLLGLLCGAVLYQSRGQLWNRDIAALSPIAESAQRLDAKLRSDLGAAELGSLVVARANDEQAALRLSETIGKRLDSLFEQRLIVGYDSPAHYLPSEATQTDRRASLPTDSQLRANVAKASAALALQPDALNPFLQQVNDARSAPLLTRASLAGTSLGLGLDALMWRSGDAWQALLPLRGEVDLARLRAALSDLAPGQIDVLNIKQQTDALYNGYLHEALRLSAIGFIAIVVLLVLALRSASRVARVMLPLVLAVLVVAAALATLHVQMTIMHLIGMLLIVAVGSNYALFFDRRAAQPDHGALPLTLASLVIANACTVIGFGVLAFSSVPVLNALGSTVAPGTLLALWFSALIAPRSLWT